MKFKNQKWSLIVNIIIIKAAICLFVLYNVIKGINGLESAKVYGIVFLIIVGLFFVFNFICINFKFQVKKKLSNEVSKYFNEGKYVECKNYLFDLTNKSNFEDVNQMILYYITLTTLYLDEIEKAKKLIEQNMMYKVNSFNVYFYASSIFLNFMIDYCSSNGYNDAYGKYTSSKELILKVAPIKTDVQRLFFIIELLNENNKTLAVQNMNNTSFYKLPIIDRFILENN